MELDWLELDWLELLSVGLGWWMELLSVGVARPVRWAGCRPEKELSGQRLTLEGLAQASEVTL